MPRWPFKRRRNSSGQETGQQLLPEKPQSPEVGSPPILASARRVSQASKEQRKRDSQQPQPQSPSAILEKEEKQTDAEWLEGDAQPEQQLEEIEQLVPEKETRPVSRTYQSREDITALPMSGPLQSSPHLRPVDSQKPAIPYNFHGLSGSQTSFQRQETPKVNSRPGTLRSKRSTTDYSAPKRKPSTNVKKRDDRVREEEIRAMSAAVTVPKRGGDTPLRRDSRKSRGLAALRDSTVSLPPEGSIHSSMSGVLEQRGWEVGALAIFNPRPNIRVAELPQYISPNSVPTSSGGVLYRIDSIGAKDKRPVTRGSGKTAKTGKSGKKRERIGDKADSLASSDLRAIMEREAKRKELKQKERQEKLEKRLRSRSVRTRKDSDIRQRDAEETRRIEEVRARAEQELRSLAPLTPPTDIHPAFRPPPSVDLQEEGMGLLPRIDTQLQPVIAAVPAEREPVSPIDETNPFADPRSDPDHEPDVSPVEENFPETPDEHSDSHMGTPMEEPVVATAQAVRMAHANTPPLSPVYSRGAAVVFPSRSVRSPVQRPTPSPAPPAPVERQMTEPVTERRSPWAMIFRRTATNPRVKETAASHAATSFSNTSRESMRNQPLPAHLVDPEARRPSASRSVSNTPVPTQSKFRENLPETPISPPDSRAQSPEAETAAPTSDRQFTRVQPIDIQRAGSGSGSPSTGIRRGHLMSASMASVDSEASWLASGSVKRQSVQSGVSRSYSKSKRNPDFTASYEDLGTEGGDKDAEYFKTSRAGSSSQRMTTALTGDTPDEEMEIVAEGNEPTSDDDPSNILRGNVEHQPLLVPRDPRIRSREGLLSEYSDATPLTGTPSPLSANSGELAPPEQDPYHGDSTSVSEYFDAEDDRDESYSDQETPFAEESPSPGEEPELQRATSVRYVSRHSRQFSAGSARLLDVTHRRVSDSDAAETPRGIRPPSSPRPF